MAEEDQLGPQELRGHGKKSGTVAGEDSDSDDDDDDDATEKALRDMERVRKYQVNRLKYYYAVAEFNSDIVADCVYKQCDGNEYELSATRFDLRFIPNDMEFNDDPPKEICDKAPDMDVYKPKLFSTTALSLGKVDLTWDETDPQRSAAMKKAFDINKDDAENDKLLKQFIASSSYDDDDNDETDPKDKMNPVDEAAEFSEEDDEKIIAKYRALLQVAEKESDKGKFLDEESDDSEGGMEMTFKPEAEMS